LLQLTSAGFAIHVAATEGSATQMSGFAVGVAAGVDDPPHPTSVRTPSDTNTEQERIIAPP
jgi:hypothetical protein